MKRYDYSIVLFIFSFLIRAYSAHHGSPYCYHNDEHWTFEQAFRMVREHSWDLDWFRIPPLLIFLYRIQITFLQWVSPANLVLPAESWFAPHQIMPSQFPVLYAGRLLICLFGSGTVALMYLILRKFFKNGWSAFYSFIYSIISVNIFYSSYLRAEPMAVFFLVLTTYFLVCYQETFVRKWLYLAGLAFGFAYGSKYNAVFYVFSAILFIGLIHSSWKPRLMDWCRFLTVSLVVLIIAVPHLFWKPGKVIADVVGNYHTYRSGELGNMGSFFENAAYYLRDCMIAPDKFSLFFVAFAFSVIFFPWVWKKAKATQRPLLALSCFFSIGYFLFLSQFKYRGERNLIFIYPFVIFCSAFVIEQFSNLSIKWFKQAALLLVAISTVGTMGYSIEYLKKCNQPLPQDRAIAWINANAPAGSIILREIDTPLINPSQFGVLHTFYVSTVKPESMIELNPRYLILTGFVHDISQNFDHEYPREFNAWIWSKQPEFEDSNSTRIPLGIELRIYDFQKYKKEYIDTFSKFIATSSRKPNP